MRSASATHHLILALLYFLGLRDVAAADAAFQRALLLSDGNDPAVRACFIVFSNAGEEGSEVAPRGSLLFSSSAGGYDAGVPKSQPRRRGGGPSPAYVSGVRGVQLLAQEGASPTVQHLFGSGGGGEVSSQAWALLQELGMTKPGEQPKAVPSGLARKKGSLMTPFGDGQTLRMGGSFVPLPRPTAGLPRAPAGSSAGASPLLHSPVIMEEDEEGEGAEAREDVLAGMTGRNGLARDADASYLYTQRMLLGTQLWLEVEQPSLLESRRQRVQLLRAFSEAAFLSQAPEGEDAATFFDQVVGGWSRRPPGSVSATGGAMPGQIVRRGSFGARPVDAALVRSIFNDISVAAPFQSKDAAMSRSLERAASNRVATKRSLRAAKEERAASRSSTRRSRRSPPRGGDA